MGIYLHSDRHRNQHTVILINPVKRISKRFQKAYKEKILETDDVFSLAFSTALHRWPAYLDYLERSCNQLVSAIDVSSSGLEV